MADIPITLVDPESKGTLSFLFRPLGRDDIGTLDIWIRSRHLNLVRESFTEDTPEAVQLRAERIAQEKASTLDFFSRDGYRLLCTIEGMAQVAFVSLRHNHPEVTVEYLRGLFIYGPNIDTLSEAVVEGRKSFPLPGHRGEPGSKKKTPQTPNKKDRKKRRKKGNRGGRKRQSG